MQETAKTQAFNIIEDENGNPHIVRQTSTGIEAAVRLPKDDGTMYETVHTANGSEISIVNEQGQFIGIEALKAKLAAEPDMTLDKNLKLPALEDEGKTLAQMKAESEVILQNHPQASASSQPQAINPAVDSRAKAMLNGEMMEGGSNVPSNLPLAEIGSMFSGDMGGMIQKFMPVIAAIQQNPKMVDNFANAASGVMNAALKEIDVNGNKHIDADEVKALLESPEKMEVLLKATPEGVRGNIAQKMNMLAEVVNSEGGQEKLEGNIESITESLNNRLATASQAAASLKESPIGMFAQSFLGVDVGKNIDQVVGALPEGITLPSDVKVSEDVMAVLEKYAGSSAKPDVAELNARMNEVKEMTLDGAEPNPQTGLPAKPQQGATLA